MKDEKKLALQSSKIEFLGRGNGKDKDYVESKVGIFKKKKKRCQCSQNNRVRKKVAQNEVAEVVKARSFGAF